LAELEWESHPERPSLRRAIRHQLRRFDPTIRVVAEAFFAEASPIDLLAVGGEGEVISVRIGQHDDDARLLTQSLADLSWLRPRLGDFLKLAPGLGIEPSAEPRAMLFATRFAAETRAAVENFPSRSIELLTYHCFRQQGQLSVLFEPCTPPQAQSSAQNTGEHRMSEPPKAKSQSPLDARLVGPPSSSGFRTGLTNADLVSDLEEEKTSTEFRPRRS
jgi:hypothetical protein